MPQATLLQPRRLGIRGIVLLKDVPTPVSPDLARVLARRPNVQVDWTEDGPYADADDGVSVDADGRPLDKDERLDAIATAIDELNPDNEEHFTRAGKPEVRALSAVLGWPVTAAERDEAMRAPVEPPAPVHESKVRIVKKPRHEAPAEDPDPSAEGAVEV
jgi:hypothetical protein